MSIALVGLIALYVVLNIFSFQRMRESSKMLKKARQEYREAISANEKFAVLYKELKYLCEVKVNEPQKFMDAHRVITVDPKSDKFTVQEYRKE